MDTLSWIIPMSEIAIAVGYIINVIWLVIIALGVLKAVINVVIYEYHIMRGKKAINKLMHVRRNLAIYLLLWLEFVVAADIIHTLVHFDLNNLILLGLLVVIRIIIGYMLEKEIQPLENK